MVIQDYTKLHIDSIHQKSSKQQKKKKMDRKCVISQILALINIRSSKM